MRNNYIEKFGHACVYNGYHIIPVCPGDKYPAYFDRGNWHALPEWDDWCNKDNTARELEVWSSWDQCSMGIACGSVVGIDIDSIDINIVSDIVAAAFDVFGKTPLIRVGQHPRCMLVYANEGDVTNISYGSDVQILSYGKQFVAHGIHRSTLLEYIWQELMPGDVPIEELPQISAAQMVAFGLRLEPILPRPVETRRDAAYAGTTSDQGLAVKETVINALSAIDVNTVSYATWLNFGLACRNSLEDEGFQVWLDWSAQDSLRFDAAIMRDKWNSFAIAPIENPITAGSIYMAATQAGWNAGMAPSWEWEADISMNIDEIIANYETRKSINQSVDSMQQQEKQKAAHALSPRTFSASSFADTVKRQWVLGTRLCREQLTVGIAPGGVGKSSVGIATACSIITGMEFTREPVHATGNVLLVQCEDDEMEINRRLEAFCKHHQFDPAILNDRLFINSDVAVPMVRDATRRHDNVAALIQFCIDKQIVAMIYDPFIKSHSIDENNNNDMDFVATQFVYIARQARIAVDLSHHTGKSSDSESHAGDAMKARGAGALLAAARQTYTLAAVDLKKDLYGMHQSQKRRLVRLDSGGKSNLSCDDGQTIWFYKHSIDIECGEEMGVFAPYDMQDKIDAANAESRARHELKRDQCLQLATKVLSTTMQTMTLGQLKKQMSAYSAADIEGYLSDALHFPINGFVITQDMGGYKVNSVKEKS